jgi:hypothetical protein
MYKGGLISFDPMKFYIFFQKINKRHLEAIGQPFTAKEKQELI